MPVSWACPRCDHASITAQWIRQVSGLSTARVSTMKYARPGESLVEPDDDQRRFQRQQAERHIRCVFLHECGDYTNPLIVCKGLLRVGPRQSGRAPMSVRVATTADQDGELQRGRASRPHPGGHESWVPHSGYTPAARRRPAAAPPASSGSGALSTLAWVTPCQVLDLLLHGFHRQALRGNKRACARDHRVWRARQGPPRARGSTTQRPCQDHAGRATRFA